MWSSRISPFALALVLVAAPAQAVDWSQAIWMAACASDWSVTYVGVSAHGPDGRLPGQHYFTEENPMVNWLAPQPAAMTALGVSIDAAAWFALQPLARRKPKLARVVFLGLAAYRSTLVVRGIHNIARADQLPTFLP